MSRDRLTQPALRVVGVVGLLIATAIHLLLGLPMIASPFGVLFILSGLGTLLGAVLLFRAPRWGWIIGGGVAGLTAIGYILRSTVGLPLLVPRPQPFFEPTLGAVCTIAEIVVAILALYALSGARRSTAIA